MLRFLGDENFNGDILRGLLLRNPKIDLVRFEEVLPKGIADPEVLEAAAQLDRILLTHDRATMPGFASDRLVANQSMPGLFILGIQYPVGAAIDHISLLDAVTDQGEWTNRIVSLPIF